MSLQIRKPAPSGLSVYAVLRRRGDEYRWIVGNGFEAFNAANLDSYDVPLTDSGGDDYATDLAFTAGVGRYIAAFYVRAGATPANDDFKLPGEEVYGWTGTVLDSAAFYTTTTNVQRYGDTNVSITGNLSNSGLFEDSAASVIDAIRAAYRLSNIVFLSANPRPDTFPVVSSIGAVNEIVTEANTVITWGVLRNDRDDQSGQRDAQGKTPGDQIIDKGLQMLRDLIAPTGAIPGVADEVTDVDEELNTVAPVAVGATQDANGCPVPTGACCAGVYDVRRVWG